MKRIIYLLAIIGVTFTGCNPIEEIYDEIDAQDNPILGSAEYTLTSEDYDDLGLNFGNFSSEDDAKAILPDFLNDLYPIWGEGSSILVGYDLFIGSAEGVSDFTGADVYELTTADYATSGSDAFGFYPDVDPDGFIPDILDVAIVSPVDGQLVRADYDQYFNDPVVGLANLYQAAFPANFDDFENIDVLGAQGWSAGAGNVQGSGWDGGAFANEDWLISPEIDLTGETDLKFQINQEIDFFGAVPESIDIFISTNYTTGGDHTAATWTTFDFDKTLYGSLTLSEDFDFSAYDDQVIHVAFKYVSDDAAAARWRIESFAIKALGVDGDANNKGDYYVYDGSEWETADDVYYLSKADYDSMGEGSGEPGRFNNFSNSTPADAYIPTFLSITSPFAFAQEEDEIFIIYKYFSTSCFCTQTRGNLYTFTNGEWVGHENVISTTLQFGHDGDSWVPDNTIRYALIGSDYSAIVAALSATYPDATSSMDNFGNFDRRTSGGSSEWTDSMVVEALNVVLNNLDPTAADEQKYIVTFIIFDGSSGLEDFAMIKTGGAWVLQ